MTNEEIRQAVIDILSDISPDEDLSNLDDAAPFRDQLQLDSMDVMDIILELRKRYRVNIPEDDYGKLDTMAHTVEYLKPHLS
ncbi:MAG: acyl carrier protein [Planctomycetaceae bacterium]|jgi:acyl carrier protein|nr:acyl carrier protein [Planctomycetaceae bacterium]